MASLLELRADGLGAATRVAKQLGPDVSREWRRGIRDAVRPIARDAQARYRGAIPLGDRAAKTVRMSVTQRGAAVRAGGFDWSKAAEFGAKRKKTRAHNVQNAFGKGFTMTGVAKAIDYSSPRLFGRWTGNRATLAGSGQVSGRALYPAAAEGLEDTLDRLQALVDDAVGSLARAAR